MKRYLIIFGSIIIIILIIVFVGIFSNRKKINNQTGPGIIETSNNNENNPIPITQNSSTTNNNTQTSEQLPIFPQITTTIPFQSNNTVYQSLFKQSFIYIDLDYPSLYVYDLNDNIIKYLNLQDETYKEILRIPNFKNAYISDDKTKIAIETNDGINILDLKKDQFWQLPFMTQKVIFTDKTILYFNNNKDISYLTYWQDNSTTKIRNLGILNPKFAILKNGLLIYEPDSPIFFLDLKKSPQLSTFLPAKNNYNILVNKNKDLIFVNFQENDTWQSEIIDVNKKIKHSFSWPTIEEKCSFDDVLVCAIAPDIKPERWRILDPVFDEKIIIYNPQNNNIKEIKLDSQFDIIKPKLTPLGIIFWNRLDAKFYLIKID
jgi:hypothetical protein